ncbi:hypothetical protein NDU88_000815 [Pleurodeles waltl]|uniref:U1-type domain-containing protein n=1 Tax=Pleurodeles waltl TaxID=8319 RepID=A0AAV7LE46_PLEWA|nr:hypothetical protein NDU88_000815 [Pleurodeles waltl]
MPNINIGHPSLSRQKSHQSEPLYTSGVRTIVEEDCGKEPHSFETIPLVVPLSRVAHPALLPQMASTKHGHGSRVIMATEDDYCKLCDSSFSSPVIAQAHYQGKNHLKRLRLAEARNNSFS